MEGGGMILQEQEKLYDSTFLKNAILESLQTRSRKVRSIVRWIERTYHLNFEENEKERLSATISIRLRELEAFGYVIKIDGFYKLSEFYIRKKF